MGRKLRSRKKLDYGYDEAEEDGEDSWRSPEIDEEEAQWTPDEEEESEDDESSEDDDEDDELSSPQPSSSSESDDEQDDYQDDGDDDDEEGGAGGGAELAFDEWAEPATSSSQRGQVTPAARPKPRLPAEPPPLRPPTLHRPRLTAPELTKITRRRLNFSAAKKKASPGLASAGSSDAATTNSGDFRAGKVGRASADWSKRKRMRDYIDSIVDEYHNDCDGQTKKMKKGQIRPLCAKCKNCKCREFDKE